MTPLPDRKPPEYAYPPANGLDRYPAIWTEPQARAMRMAVLEGKGPATISMALDLSWSQTLQLLRSACLAYWRSDKEDEQAQFRGLRGLARLGLPEALANVLRRHGITTVEDLWLQQDVVGSFAGIGDAAMRQITQALEQAMENGPTLLHAAVASAREAPPSSTR